jgi:alpha-D-ribose 1-methylphosphonate 5-triphosphate synthase subunit PhnG
MLQFDGTRGKTPDNPRKNWMELLARAPLDLLETAISPFCGQQPQWLRTPETGLIMLQGRAGGTGERFNLGEATVTRCALRPDPAIIDCKAMGIAYVMGRSKRHAELAATADALLQDPACSAQVPADLLARIDAWLESERRARHARAQATRVEFFTLAREGSAAEDTPENVQ